MAVLGQDAYVTLVLNDSYLPGAMVLGHSLQDVGTKKQLAALVTLDSLSLEAIDELKTIYHIIPVERISNPEPANLWLMGRPDLIHAFTKIALWRQTQYRKIVYLDSDIVVLQNIDELFDLDAPFAAAPDIGWPDAFNTGLMTLTPNMGDFWALQTLANSGDSFDGADQGLLNQYYEHRNWHRLSYTYNTTPSAHYQWEPAYRFYKSKIKTVHFIGKDKPWLVGRHGRTGSGTHNELVSRWWAVYDRHYKQAPSYVPGQSYSRSTAVQSRTFGEAIDVYYGLPPEERLPPLPTTEIAPGINNPQPAASFEQQHTHIPDVTVQGPSPEPAVQPHREPPPQQPQQELERPFSAPQMQWDATRSAPPIESQPEAAYFPSEHYTFEGERKPFRPPVQYPDAPKDMWYNVPESKPAPEAPPPPIFPWEKKHRPQTSRVFADDLPPSPDLNKGSPSEWKDSAGGIDRYIKNIHEEQVRKSIAKAAGVEDVVSPTGRRESLIFTGFPPEDARPSLPVTPAPILTHTFWGDDHPEDDPNLPPAKGVPEPAEWNPAEKLEELRRSSLIEVEKLVLPTRVKSEEAPEKSKANLRESDDRLPSDAMSDLELATESDESAVVRTLEKVAEGASEKSPTSSVPTEFSTSTESTQPESKISTGPFVEPDYTTPTSKTVSKDDSLKTATPETEVSPTRR